MYQLVNLYQPVFRQQPKLLSTTALLTISALALILLSVVAIKAHSTTQGLQRTAEELALSYTQLNARIASAASIETEAESNSVSDQITTLQSQADERDALLNRIDALLTGNRNQFGDVFETLATLSLPGLWLTGINLDSSGNIEITGTTGDPKLVPRYLQLITDDSPLTSLNLGSVNITRGSSSAAGVDFVLSYQVSGAVP